MATKGSHYGRTSHYYATERGNRLAKVLLALFTIVIVFLILKAIGFALEADANFSNKIIDITLKSIH